MKVYFTASINQRSELEDEYKAIKQSILGLRHDCVEAFDVMHKQLDDVMEQPWQEAESFYQKWKKVVSAVDVAVVEASFPSTVNIGLELSGLFERGKPTIVLYRTGRDPVFVGDFHSTRVVKLEYESSNIKEVLKYGFEEAEQMMNRRFTFFITPEIDARLDRVSSKKGVSRSEYLRDLVMNDMEGE